jgi:hypothetical protein
VDVVTANFNSNNLECSVGKRGAGKTLSISMLGNGRGEVRGGAFFTVNCPGRCGRTFTSEN